MSLITVTLPLSTYWGTRLQFTWKTAREPFIYVENVKWTSPFSISRMLEDQNNRGFSRFNHSQLFCVSLKLRLISGWVAFLIHLSCNSEPRCLEPIKVTSMLLCLFVYG